ncbi:MAG: hypothetical protein Q9174_007278, partial [Haloplaca sp. 1 TL-2023]
MVHIFHSSKKEKEKTKESSTKSYGSSPERASLQNLHLRQADESEKGLWQQAWEQVKTEVDWKLPASLQNVEHLSAKHEVRAIRDEAQKRRDSSENDQRRMFGSRFTYREVCDNVSQYAKKFEFIGDMVTQAEPVYSALPWTVVRFVINCAVGESETYHNILD